MIYDIYIESVPPSDDASPPRSVMRFGFEKHLGISGFQKTVNKWLKILLTEEGSDYLNKSLGTRFSLLFESNISNPNDVSQVVIGAVDKATQDVLRVQQNDNTLEIDEILVSTRIVSLEFSRLESRVSVKIDLKNAAGQVLTAQIPVRLV